MLTTHRLATTHPDSAALTAIESGIARALQGRPAPAGATPALARAHWRTLELIAGEEEVSEEAIDALLAELADG